MVSHTINVWGWWSARNIMTTSEEQFHEELVAMVSQGQRDDGSATWWRWWRLQGDVFHGDSLDIWCIYIYIIYIYVYICTQYIYICTYTQYVCVYVMIYRVISNRWEVFFPIKIHQTCRSSYQTWWPFRMGVRGLDVRWDEFDGMSWLVDVPYSKKRLVD